MLQLRGSKQRLRGSKERYLMFDIKSEAQYFEYENEMQLISKFVVVVRRLTLNRRLIGEELSTRSVKALNLYIKFVIEDLAESRSLLNTQKIISRLKT